MIFLIDEKYLADNTSVSINKNSKDIRVALQLVTVIHLKPLLGSALYQVYESYLKDSTPLTDAQETLFESIKYYIALKVEREMLLNVVNLSNKGATEAENAASLEVVRVKRQEVEAAAEVVKSHILEYLGANPEDFPEYRPAGGVAAAKTNRNVAGILFDDKPKVWIQ